MPTARPAAVGASAARARRAARAAAIVLALAGAARAAAAPAPPPPAPPAQRTDGRAVHAIVVAAGPSVADRLAAAGWPAWRGLAADVAAAAAQPATRARLRAWRAATLASQQGIVAQARALGVDVVARYAIVGNGVQVVGPADAVARLAAAPGAVALEPAPRLRLARPASPPAARPAIDPLAVGRRRAADAAVAHGPATRVAADAADDTAAPADGAGQTIAIIDTGIDYTHAAFGGPGTAAAYAAARGAAERIDDDYDGRPLFPNGRVVGGWDFVGPNYTSPERCPPAEAAAGGCTGTPRPDPDPLDAYGHGTSVAGLAAGSRVAGLAPGVAPAADLVALKVFGPPSRGADTDEAADVVIDAIEWCAGANLGLERRGVVPARIDVVNLSLGEPWAQGSRFFDAAIANAVNAGIVVVAAAGNQGDRPFVLTAPGSSPQALAVAASNGGAARDVIGTFSGRGPSRHGALKPDLTAPGVQRATAALGSGDGVATSSGTSMASPEVAGAAALVLAQLARRVAASGWVPGGASDVAARLVNAASPLVVDARGAPAPVVRQGAGRLDVGRALSATLIARVGDGASVQLGRWPRSQPGPRTVVLDVFNPTADAIRFRLAVRRRAAPRLRVDVAPGAHLAPPGGRLPVTATFTLPPDDPGPALGAAYGGTLAAAAYDAAADNGWLELWPEGDGAGAPDAPLAAVPFAAVLRASAAATVTMGGGAPAASLRLAQPDAPGAVEATVELFHRLTEPDGDPDEPAVRYEADLWHVGARWSGVAEGDGGDGPRLTIGLARHAPAVVPYGVVLRTALDVDGDGTVDRAIDAGVEAAVLGAGADDAMVAAVRRWDPAAGAPAGPPLATTPLPFALDSRVLAFDVRLADLGLAAPRGVTLAVESRGRLEDWLPLDDGDGRAGDAVSAVDVVPDGASLARPADGAPWLAVPAPGARAEPRPWRATVPPGGAVAVRIVAPCRGEPAGFLALTPANLAATATGAADVQLVEPAAALRRAAGCRLWLPLGWRAAR